MVLSGALDLIGLDHRDGTAGCRPPVGVRAAGTGTRARKPPINTVSERSPSTLDRMDTDEKPTPRREVHDARNKDSLPGTLVRSEGDDAVGDELVNGVYDALGTTFEFFRDAYGRNSLDGEGGPLRATVHYREKFPNMFWDGRRFVLGDGDGEIFRLRPNEILDIVAAGMTRQIMNPQLLYAFQSGALSESVADVFASLVKQYALGQTADQADWLLGIGIIAPSVKAKALRSLAAPGTAYDDPNLGKDPQKAHTDDYHDMPIHKDNGGVHINSGIPNRAFHLTATAIGGNAWEKAGRIWYDAATGGKLSEEATFADFAKLTVATAEELYGTGGALDAVNDAWRTVGVL
ncbi:M4 family metallopeptidase [Kitasatospora sp. NPDC057500]|uniref:M4 family metallopeptidase n=1 Tax=Kitasatospora sp. NPDC057500 TaxID=3346151 RepID=UPI0036C25A31